ncbi:hypothetical protein MKW98_022383 [Papaver atlanticum]|uniref:Transmembrane protein n=1 Tax=Papaver atlanticum TaxID=357466 RepID=A0AAD4XI97_9MAGN|nr:hypothetical protein MKW98_022383 [Papaver atlanticum]
MQTPAIVVKLTTTINTATRYSSFSPQSQVYAVVGGLQLGICWWCLVVVQLEIVVVVVQVVHNRGAVRNSGGGASGTQLGPRA